jgi:3-phenylpropionate/cinnamic acid dioxygenase small subunit
MALPQRLSQEEAERFLRHEARLLDERRLEEWESLFTPDGVYWLPMADGTDPEQEPSVIYDTSLQRSMRVHQLLHQTHYAQTPPSRTLHFIANVDVEDDGGEDVVVRCNTIVYEVRPGDQQDLQVGLGRQRSLAAQCEYQLRYDGRWLIARKKVLLLDRDLPLYNLTFIL